jgi:hypothetical protein
MVEPIRSKWMDPDFRREPKTSHFCAVCQRDLKPEQPHRRVLFTLADYAAVHVDDWLRAQGETGEGYVIEAIGMDCARRLGPEWSASKD